MNMTPPTNQKYFCSSIGLLNYYRDMWAKWSHLLQALTVLMSNKLKCKWTNVEQKVFNEIKQIVTCDALLIYPDFNKCFDIHADASEFQLGEVISQDGKRIVFYSRKLTNPQQQYTVTETELLSIVETLKEFCKNVLGKKIIYRP